MKITKDNALAFAKQCISRAQSISNLVKVSIEVDKKTGAQRDYGNDVKDIDTLKSLADRAMKLLDTSSPAYSFAEQKDDSIVIDPSVDFNDRKELNKIILAVLGKENISYTQAFNKVVYKK